METNEIKDLLSQFDQSSLTELQLKKENIELYFNKNSFSSRQVSSESSDVKVESIPAATPVPSVQPTAAGTVEVSSEPIIAGTEIVSPLVGVVYLKPSPEQSQFKQIGDSVKKGDVLCIVEAMKVMNEIVSDVDGELVEILVENEQIVEYDQPLFRVKEG
ncbi:acetyl-CoA carboxylase biotin carboxyl carrier protein [Enterococcus gallinarum]|uniref:Biotin carboxyl carrier protein of acetyl-CoA carboxylase n=1 Tax=Enterococcus gallinarum TaxID=1353 RepID=A0AAE7T105_ENTGA|nr:acetyl-CoA carboxylase biotin carboxyl carrier protein [Enterococcus gallinarum]MBM6741584.1 acetyl-CoA carboxylase biotin carboxyl carrier protein [Enterococcus gallinarum]MBW5472186.1 acetyl-CoA carboxylase biotin carboxyl carrier protein [Enterococcus gallinarum]MCR1927706.1 acetyl-CoA carboxylase biotin carboxyl carrier protein [Enterococcus gallinarum]MDQ6112427.1 acetyl-CoA carboxylase biotin carboxyl carrier protein [Enterococcus gallinarum]MDT2682144.1 acetyl-CoA carboxylase biotin 